MPQTRGADLAVLGPLETDKRPLPLADGEQLVPGSDLYLIGYPAEYDVAPEPTITGGLLSRVRYWGGYDLTLLQTDAAITGGQSGGALIDGRGRVVGVSTWHWTVANSGVATSAIDDAQLVDLMLTDTGYNFSFHDRIDLEVEPSPAWEIELGGSWDRATFVVEEVTDTINLEVTGSGAASLWMADSFDVWIGSDTEAHSAGSAEIDPHEAYFVEVGQASTGAASYTLRSSATLLPYYDEDGAILLAADETTYSLAGVFDYFGDIDLYQLELQQGETVVIWTDSILTDTALAVWNSASTVVATDDDSGPIGPMAFRWNAQIEFEAPSSAPTMLRCTAIPEAATSSPPQSFRDQRRMAGTTRWRGPGDRWGRLCSGIGLRYVKGAGAKRCKPRSQACR